MSDMELKPCPFCGKAGDVKKYAEWPENTREVQIHYSAGCYTEGCIAEMPIDVFFETEQQAIKAWNTRGGE